ncbi:hypothetical protein GKZ90_0010375 [Flavobacterium sp. MC2016-06]|uniref:hypothetical protein n=1 Tax=Flavobacterium sp. MC2016-06 TaxID=2676308 RepID=UPI0012BA5C27|nr:hypothetical protein [Flavobacterium sp. MC2016-06]MBU3858505.1 hypothetical protein [Flavobacterium sp. MC2016-06]
MRILILLTIAILTFSCNNREKSNLSNNKNLQNLPDKEKGEIDVLNKNAHYIGFINKFYFSNKNEAYIELYFTKDEISSKEYAKLEKLTDSVIYEDDENSRNRFPERLSAKNFDLRGLSKLAIFNDAAKFVCHADFVRVEYLNQDISSSFIAVYKTDKKIKSDDNYYGISNFEKSLETANYTISKDTILTKNILTKLNVPESYNGLKNNGTHILFAKSDTVLSVVNSENSAYIVLLSGGEFKVLYKSPEPENINDLKVIPIIKNKLPYLLTRNSKPDTDMSWDKLLYYDGREYIKTNRQRIE